MKISIGFRWFDLWVGVYIDRHNNAVYVCPLPTIVIKFQRDNQRPPIDVHTLCRDCQHTLVAHSYTTGSCIGCGCPGFVMPDNV